jgi:hypothetical protein
MGNRIHAGLSVPRWRVWAAAPAVLGLLAALVVGAPPEASASAHSEPPVQYPFACTAQDHGLELIVDNHDGQGVAVTDGTGAVVGYSRDCEADTRYWYFWVDEAGDRHVLMAPGEAAPTEIPETVATTTLTDGREVPYLIRHERGILNRFIYSTSMLATVDEVLAGDPTEPDPALWNGRLLFQFQGGVGIGHTQGRYDERAIAGQPDRLGKGYAVIYSTGTRTGEHYNLLVGGRTAVMVKDHFVATHGEPTYTVAIGGSGGGIQQYVYAQNHPDLLDAAIPQRSYPDMTTQTIHVGDCALLDRYMDVDAAGDTTWRDWDNRRWLQGLNSIDGYFGSTARTLRSLQGALGLPVQTGSSECLEGWFGLSPLAMNPHYGAEANWHLLPEDELAAIERTHWDDAVEAYGRDPETGFARVAWDNVGVQYGLRALSDGRLTPDQFLDVNARVGSWVEAEDMVQEGAPFVGADGGRFTGGAADQMALATGTLRYDPWSMANQHLSPDGGVTPALRREGDLEAIRAAYSSGLVFRGELPREIPIIDVRDYLEHVLDMHNSHQSFAARQRLLDGQGHADNHVVWFLDTPPNGRSPAVEDFTHAAFDVIAEWIANLREHPDRTVADARPPMGQDSCFATDGTLIASGVGAWDGVLDDGPDGPCTQRFELFTTSRIEAGAPISGDVYKCHTMPVDTAVAEGLYGNWSPDGNAIERLRAMFPEGVCDYDVAGVADPRAEVAPEPAVRQVGRNLQVEGTRGATIEIRQDGEVVATATANAAGRATVTGLDAGTYVLRQLIDGRPGLRTAPIDLAARPGRR